MSTSNSVLVFFFLLAFSQFTTASGATWYVDGALPSSGDGTSWETAFKTIREGIEASSDGDAVIVGPWTYYQRIEFKGKNIVLRSTNPLDPAVVEKTVIDGFSGGPVVTFSGTEDQTCVLSGFTIRRGRNEGKGGGGIFGGYYGGPTHAMIENNVIRENAAPFGAGIAYCSGMIRGNTVIENRGERGAGGLSLCHGVIEGNTVSDNYNDGLESCTGVIQNNVITGNSGCGLDFCNGLVQNNIISNNDGHGLAECSGTVQNNIISGNTPSTNGGGLYCCDGTVQNNLVINNGSHSGGGLSNCDGKVLNNTICGNRALYGGGLYQCKGIIRNCIIWGNTGEGSGAQIYESSTPAFSCIQDWTGDGVSNTADDPLFVDDPAGDYHLQEGSPCIGTGSNYYWLAWPQRDLDGNCRLAGKGVDAGCYEFGAPHDSDGDLFSDEKEVSRGTNPLDDDSDDDGLRDGLEMLRGSNPLNVTPPGILHVPSDIPTVQGAICVSFTGDEIIVAPGIYWENVHFAGTDIILRSSEPENQEVVASTVLDGGGGPSVATLTGNETEACVLAGFTIQNGKAQLGGAIYGGTWEHRSRAMIRNNVIMGNTAVSGGGLAFCDGLIRKNVIDANSATKQGGGLYRCDGTIEDNLVRGNSADRGGGVDDCGGLIQRNTIIHNRADEGGGLGTCGGTIRNNLICGNSALWRDCGGGYGGGLYGCDGVVESNTVVWNSAEWEGGGFSRCEGTIRNCIIWENRAYSGRQLHESATPSYSCFEGEGADREGNMSKYPRFYDPFGPDRLPETCDDNDYRLFPGSPCIDAGENEGWMWDAVDLDGNPRIFYGGSSKSVDMGAYEYGSWPFKVLEMRPVGGDGALLTWTSRPGDTYTVWSCLELSAAQWTEETTLPSGGETTVWAEPDTTGPRKFYKIELR